MNRLAAIERSQETLNDAGKSRYQTPQFSLSCGYNGFAVKCRKGTIDDHSGYYQLQQEIPFVRFESLDGNDEALTGLQGPKPPFSYAEYKGRLQQDLDSALGGRKKIRLTTNISMTIGCF